MKTEIGCSDHLENKLLSWWIVNLGRKPVRHILYLLLISLWGKRSLPLWIASKAEASEGSQDSPAFHMPSLPAESAHVNTPFSSVPRSFWNTQKHIFALQPYPRRHSLATINQKTLLSSMQQICQNSEDQHTEGHCGQGSQLSTTAPPHNYRKTKDIRDPRSGAAKGNTWRLSAKSERSKVAEGIPRSQMSSPINFHQVIH